MNTRRWLQGLGPLTQAAEAWPWWTCAAALLGALVLAVGLSPQWQQDAERHLSPLQGSRTAGRDGADARPAVTLAPSSVPKLPAAAQTPGRVAALTAFARRQGLTLVLVQEQADVQGQMQLVLSGQARYPALRAFVAGTLATDAAAVLERLRLQRAEATTAELDFEMQWTLLHHVDPPAAVTATTPGRDKAAP